MSDDYTRLRELAAAAEGGDWHVKAFQIETDDGLVYIHDVIDPGFSNPVAFCDQRAEVAEFIAAANPATILRLLDEIERLRAGETRT